MALTEDQRLRQLLGESIPEGGEAGDTMFTDLEIEDLLERTAGDLDRAAYEGWRVKAAKLSSLVDSTEGNVQRKFSQLHEQALDQVKLGLRSTAGLTEGRTRVGRIRRGPIPWD